MSFAFPFSEEPPMRSVSSVPDNLRNAANTYEERNKLYGDNYKNFGNVMEAMFPEGLLLNEADDWNRFGVFTQIVSKLTRYAVNLTDGGHTDSAHDMVVYSAMLEELTDQKDNT